MIHLQGKKAISVSHPDTVKGSNQPRNLRREKMKQPAHSQILARGLTFQMEKQAPFCFLTNSEQKGADLRLYCLHKADFLTITKSITFA